MSNGRAISGYDIVGDIHGRSDQLRRLLAMLGYGLEDGVYSRPDRQVLFIGDFVDRGDQVGEALAIVKGMVDAGAARAIIGNHEYNIVRYYTPDGNGGYLRERDGRNNKQVAKTKAFFDAVPEVQDMYLAWFRSLPMFLELDALRLVHAAWNAAAMTLLAGRETMDTCGCATPLYTGTPEEDAVELILKGPEVRLPDGFRFTDRMGSVRRKMRLAWWADGKGKTYREAAAQERGTFPDVPLPDNVAEAMSGYADDQKPVFIGHYGFGAFPGLMAPNVACVDYTDGVGIGAYRWNGESELKEENFVTVPAETRAPQEVES